MLLSALILLCITSLRSFTLATESLFITNDYIEELKKDTSLSWTPGRVFDEKKDFSGFSTEERCSEKDIESIPVLEEEDDLRSDVRKLPKFFDARKKWKYCPSIRQIRDQANCEAYWAMSVASVLSDRYCIASRGKVKLELSAQNLLSCCEDCGNCQKGCICSSWRYAATNGLVTGGEFNSNKGCYPYEFRPCGGHDQPTCEEEPTPSKCVNDVCKNSNYNVPFKEDLHKAELSYRLPNSTLAIKKELIRHGPITALFKIYKDFLTYKKGIYRRGACKKVVGETTVKILGWGTHKKVGEYWILANSWGSQWGEKGTFRYKIAGDNFVNDHVLAALPKKRKDLSIEENYYGSSESGDVEEGMLNYYGSSESGDVEEGMLNYYGSSESGDVEED